MTQDHTSNKLWPSIKRLDQVITLLLKDWWEDPRKVIRLLETTGTAFLQTKNLS
ncbi:MAG: hypothetical protein O3C43_15705 [Verrucomicrobia bacterium]|nr:hypothetical protein [Verrucomicrobiota bacterium]MDA1067937.1 hypothetical protein [Verrucomicrobiota bacterium]